MHIGTKRDELTQRIVALHLRVTDFSEEQLLTALLDTLEAITRKQEGAFMLIQPSADRRLVVGTPPDDPADEWRQTVGQ